MTPTAASNDGRASPRLGRSRSFAVAQGRPRPRRGANISYEEFHPYGTTAWWTDPGSTVSQKRYRYTGKEKDEESGLYYHGARYFAPWLARWTSADPIGLSAGINRYQYVSSAPTRLIDPTGTSDVSPLPAQPVCTPIDLDGNQWVDRPSHEEWQAMSDIERMAYRPARVPGYEPPFQAPDMPIGGESLLAPWYYSKGAPGALVGAFVGGQLPERAQRFAGSDEGLLLGDVLVVAPVIKFSIALTAAPSLRVPPPGAPAPRGVTVFAVEEWNLLTEPADIEVMQKAVNKITAATSRAVKELESGKNPFDLDIVRQWQESVKNNSSTQAMDYGNAIQKTADQYLRLDQEFMDLNPLFNKGSQAGTLSKNGNLVINDYQIPLASNPRIHGIIDITTEAQAPKLFTSYYEPVKVPHGTNVLYKNNPTLKR